MIKAFEAARFAPSGGNFQGWKFLVIKNKEVINKLADAHQEKMDIITTWPEAQQFGDAPASYRKRAVFFRHAPVGGGRHRGPLPKHHRQDTCPAARAMTPLSRQIIENRSVAPTRVEQIGGIVAHLLLLFHSMGLGACWMTGPLVAKKEMEEILGISSEWDLMAMIPVGYPAETPECREKKTVEELVTFI